MLIAVAISLLLGFGYYYKDAIQADISNAFGKPAKQSELPANNPDFNTPANVPATKSDTSANILEPKMLTIPTGEFQMGSNYGSPGEKPAHTVKLSSFAIGSTEVTFNEYDQYAEATGKPKPNDEGWGRGDRPVINLSWDDAVAYAAWLAKKTGKNYRLPTEAEWEYAARAGTQTAYWWGNAVGTNRANCKFCGSQWDNHQTAPVGSFEPNALGLYDTAGNVLEFTADCWNDSYKNAPTDGTAWLTTDGGECSHRVVRGGSWNSNPQNLWSVVRYWVGNGDAGNNLGFRLATTP